MDSPNYYGASFIGRRSNNEDNFRIKELASNTFFIAVADGMGGAVGGEIASSLILFRIEKYLIEQFKKVVNLNDLKIILSDCFLLAQTVIREKLEEEPDLKGMGSTLTCALISNGAYVWGNLGDSRLYLINPQSSNILTTDHTYLFESWEQGRMQMTPENVASYGHIITRVIDGGFQTADLYPKNENYSWLNKGELLLACSDGAILNKGILSTDWLKELVDDSLDVKSLASNIIDHAFINGSSDNITVVIYQNEYLFNPVKKSAIVNRKGEYISKPTQKPFYRQQFFTKYIYIIIVLIVLSLGTGFFSGSLFNKSETNSKLKKLNLTNNSNSDNQNRKEKTEIDSSSQRNVYFAIIRKADSLETKGKLEEAIICYKNAERLYLGDSYTTGKISSLDSKIESKMVNSSRSYSSSSRQDHPFLGSNPKNTNPKNATNNTKTKIEQKKQTSSNDKGTKKTQDNDTLQNKINDSNHIGDKTKSKSSGEKSSGNTKNDTTPINTNDSINKK
jgi:serine/threonine protein phosphatase PrpC